jgi:hypothetical protein
MLHNWVKSKFPSLKLFYEKNTHKKVKTDYYVAIPYGKKYFAWFTFHNNENVCVLIEIKVEKEGGFSLVSSEVRPVCFNNTLALGTLLFGTLISKTKFFCVENIFMFKNQRVNSKSNKERLLLLEQIFTSELRQASVVSSELIFGMAPISNSFKWLIKEIAQLPYAVYSIQCKHFGNNNAYKMMYKAFEREEQTKETRVFMVTASIGVDNYQLLNEKTDELVDIAYVPNFQTSKLMNSIFRIIKENDNLDALEESEEEEDFEDSSADKYVDLEKRVKMECKMHPTFKKWVPIKLLS